MPPKRRAAAVRAETERPKRPPKVAASRALEAPPVPAAAPPMPRREDAPADLFEGLVFALLDNTIAGMEKKAFAKLITDHGGVVPTGKGFVRFAISGTAWVPWCRRFLRSLACS